MRFTVSIVGSDSIIDSFIKYEIERRTMQWKLRFWNDIIGFLPGKKFHTISKWLRLQNKLLLRMNLNEDDCPLRWMTAITFQYQELLFTYTIFENGTRLSYLQKGGDVIQSK